MFNRKILSAHIDKYLKRTKWSKEYERNKSSSNWHD